MAILNRVGSVLVTGLAAAAVIGLSTAATPAAVTWTVSPGGSITATSGTVTLTDTTTGNSISCTSSTLTGTLKKGKGLAGKAIGKFTKVAYSGCSVSGVAVTVTPSHLPWKINLTSYKSGVSTGTVSGIMATMSASSFGCSGTVGGKTATATGTVGITYTNPTSSSSTGTLAVVAGAKTQTTHLWGVTSGCLGLVNTGDAASISSSAPLSQTITSP